MKLEDSMERLVFVLASVPDDDPRPIAEILRWAYSEVKDESKWGEIGSL